MESASVLGILSSWEVIAAGLVLMLLLPLVFTVASLKSPVRRPLTGRARSAMLAARRRAVKPRADEGAEETAAPRPAARTREPADRDAEDES